VSDQLVSHLRLLPEHDSDLDVAFQSHYPELKRIASARLLRNGTSGDVSTTTLVHESYLKMSGGKPAEFADNLRFLAYASRVIRSVMVDMVREQQAKKRGGDVALVTLGTEQSAEDEDDNAGGLDVQAVDAALKDLAEIDRGLARIVEMRFFAGLTETEIAAALNVSDRTVRREWQKARALLLTIIEQQ
jgi:RNA polymerase sigma factor (TIGR02999 family)